MEANTQWVKNKPSWQRKEYRTWQRCQNRCIAAGSRLSYPFQDGQKGNPG